MKSSMSCFSKIEDPQTERTKTHNLNYHSGSNMRRTKEEVASIRINGEVMQMNLAG